MLSENFQSRAKPAVFVDGSGGTIASVPSPNGRQAKLALDEIVDRFVPEVRNYARLVCPSPGSGEGCEELIDSTEADHSHFTKCASVHFRQMQRRGLVGQVRPAGTDTLDRMASRMRLMLRNPTMPIIITGAQRGFDERWSDAPRNFRDAVFAASHPEMPAGVWVVFNGRIMDPRFVVKRSSSDVDAFASVNGDDVGEVEAPDHLRISYTAAQADGDEEPQLLPEFELGVKVEVIDPDYEPKWLSAVLERPDIRGLVLRGYGLGNIPTRLRPPLQRWAATKPIVVGTQCFSGPVNLGKYEVGQLARETGVLSAGNLSPAYAVALLQWLMPRTEGLQHLREVWDNTVQSSLCPGTPPTLKFARTAQAA